MTFRVSSRVQDSAQAESEMRRITSLVGSSNLTPNVKASLSDQVSSAMLVFRDQLAIPGRTIKAQRLFEGDGYKVTIRVSQGRAGFLAQLSRLLGR